MATFPITITARDDASRVFESVAGKAQQMSARVSGAGDSAKQLDSELKNVGQNDGLRSVARDADGAAAGLAKTGDAANATGARLEKLRNAGAAMAAIGAGGLLLANQLIAVSEEGRGVEQRLESILKVQGRINDLASINESVQDITVKGNFADDDEIRNAAVLMASYSVQTGHLGDMLEIAARQARTMGLSVEDVSNQLSRAYGSGNVAALKRSGVLLTEQQVEAVKAAYGISQVNGQMEFMRVVTEAVRNNTVGLADSLTETQAAANNAARAMDDAMTNAGEGAATAKQQVDTVIFSVLSLVNASPELEKAAGYFGFFGSAAATAGGTVLTVASQVGMLTLAFPGLEAASVTAFTAMKTAAATTIPFLVGVARALMVPFAVLAAGAAAGIAAYEALRALNIGGFGDTHKSTAEIMADTRKTLLGDPAAEAAKITGASALPVGATESVAGSLQVSSAGAAIGGDAKSTAKAESKASRSAATAIKAAQRAKEKERKAIEKAREKERKAFSERMTTMADNDAEARIATIEEMYATRIAGLEAMKDDDNSAKIEYQIAQLEAAKMKEVAAVFKDGEGEIEHEQKQRIAAIRSGGLLKRAGITFNKAMRDSKSTGASTLAALRGMGGGISDAFTNGGAMFNPNAYAAYGGAGAFASVGMNRGATGQGIGYGGPSNPYRVRNKVRELPNNKVRIEFDPIELDKGAADRYLENLR